jgi:hypothetical protein
MTMKVKRCLVQPAASTPASRRSASRALPVSAGERTWFPIPYVFAVITVITSSLATVKLPAGRKVPPDRLAFPRINQPMLSHMSRTRSQRARALNKKAGFRPGHSGACEARLFLFAGETLAEG